MTDNPHIPENLLDAMAVSPDGAAMIRVDTVAAILHTHPDPHEIADMLTDAGIALIEQLADHPRDPWWKWYGTRRPKR